jgi:DegV family protein with EDD domain
MNTKKVAVVTDSNVCLPPDLVEQLDIGVVPIWLIFGETAYRDGVDITPADFYVRLRTADSLPTTSAPSPSDFLRVFERLQEQAKSILVITVSSQLSMVYEAAIIARESMNGYPIEVLDGRTATMAQGFIVRAAARAIAAGADLHGAVAAARETMPRVGFFFALETLTYLHRGGRVPAIAEWVGRALRLHPILIGRDGDVAVLGAGRTRRQVMERMLVELEQRAGSRSVEVAVCHADAVEAAQEFRRAIAARFNCSELFTVEFTPVMGAHTGPGVVGLAYCLAEEDHDNNKCDDPGNER